LRNKKKLGVGAGVLDSPRIYANIRFYFTGRRGRRPLQYVHRAEKNQLLYKQNMPMKPV